MVYGKELPHNETLDILEVECKGPRTRNYTLLPGFFEISHINLISSLLFPMR